MSRGFNEIGFRPRFRAIFKDWREYEHIHIFLWMYVPFKWSFVTFVTAPAPSRSVGSLSQTRHFPEQSGPLTPSIVPPIVLPSRLVKRRAH